MHSSDQSELRFTRPLLHRHRVTCGEHLTSRPPSLRALGHEIPTALDELVARLLRKDRRDRYRSMHGVAAESEDQAARPHELDAECCFSRIATLS